jgi:PleD family two-component response regulator
VTDIKPKILVVEDDLDVAEMLNAFFCDQGYEVFTVNWGKDGVRSCQTVHPDLIILDIRLPDIDGYEVASRVRGDRRTAEIPIIFLTEKRSRSDRLLGLEIGADDYITKPFDLQELRLRVKNALKRASRGSLNNIVTALPEGALVDEKLSETLGWDGVALLLVSIDNMDSFRETYGFVAADDVLRAISMMIVNTMHETISPDEFLGHLDGTDFILVLNSSNLVAMSAKLRVRLEQAMEYFYPARNREEMAGSKFGLKLNLTALTSFKDRFTEVEQIKTELMRLKK